MKPVRIQLRRKAGFNLQGFSQNLNGLPAVHVARPGKWGNLFRVGMAGIPDAATAVEFYRRAMTGDYDQTALLKAGFPGHGVLVCC